MTTDTDESTEEARALCPGCFHELPDEVDFCPGCNAPVGMITLVDPLREAKAGAYIYRRIAASPNSNLLFRGGIVLFGAYLIMAVGFAAMFAADLSDSSIDEWFGFALLVLLYGSFGAVGLYKIFHSKRALPAESSMDDPVS